MSSIRPPLNDELIRELTEWTLQQFALGIRHGKLDIRNIVCRLLREGQRTKQAQMHTDTKRRSARMPKGKKMTPTLTTGRNTSGIVGICPLAEADVQYGWVAYYQKDGVQQRKRFRFSDFGDAAFAEAKAWREEGLQARIRAAEDARQRPGAEKVSGASEPSSPVPTGEDRSTEVQPSRLLSGDENVH